MESEYDLWTEDDSARVRLFWWFALVWGYASTIWGASDDSPPAKIGGGSCGAFAHLWHSFVDAGTPPLESVMSERNEWDTYTLSLYDIIGCDIIMRLWLQDVISFMYWLTKTCHVSDAIHGFDAWHGTRMTRGLAFRPCVLRSHKLSKRLAKRCAAGSPASRNGRSKISSLHFITRWLSSRPCSSHRCLHRSFYASVSTISQRLLSQICGPQRMLSESEGFSIWRVLSNDWRQQKMWKHNRNPNR
jgi:hypothetical protein